MCDEVVDNSLAALKFIPDWFVTGKMIKKPFTALYADENEDSGSRTLMKILVMLYLIVRK